MPRFTLAERCIVGLCASVYVYLVAHIVAALQIAMPVIFLSDATKKRKHRSPRKAYTEAAQKKNLLKPVPHPRVKCACVHCDSVRRTNATMREVLGWSADYPPAFYKGDTVDGHAAEWQAADRDRAVGDEWTGARDWEPF